MVLIAQLGEHCTGIAEVVGSNPAQHLKIFSGLCSSSVTAALALMTEKRVEIRRTAEYFLQNFRCLDSWWNTLECWIYLLNQNKNLDWVSKPPLYDFSMYNTSDYLAELSHAAELQFLSDKICTWRLDMKCMLVALVQFLIFYNPQLNENLLKTYCITLIL